MRGLAVIGNLARDTIDGGPPSVGGAPYHAARALRLLGGRARIVARCAEADRRALLPPLTALGVPVEWRAAATTAAFALRYDGEQRTLELEAPGEPWTNAAASAVGRAAWIQVGALTRADFPLDVLAGLARGRRLALDGQALVRPAHPGTIELDAEFDPALLRHVTVLKLAEDETDVLGGAEAVAELGVPELRELAASVALAGEEGAVVGASVAAKATALRTRALAEAEAAAESASERMALPTVMLLVGFVIFIGYPAVAAVLSGF